MVVSDNKGTRHMSNSEQGIVKKKLITVGTGIGIIQNFIRILLFDWISL